MNVLLNGHLIDIFESLSLKQFLERKGFLKRRVAVELNGNIVPRSSYENTILESGDKLEIIGVVGGG